MVALIFVRDWVGSSVPSKLRVARSTRIGILERSIRACAGFSTDDALVRSCRLLGENDPWGRGETREIGLYVS